MCTSIIVDRELILCSKRLAEACKSLFNIPRHSILVIFAIHKLLTFMFIGQYSPVLGNISVPQPVFFRSIEPPSLAYQKKLDQALQNLTREDPSLSVRIDSETGQTIVSGMGELHLEIMQVSYHYSLSNNTLSLCDHN